MAAATGAHSFWELIRIARWHVEEDAYRRALAMVVEAHAGLPMARFWGAGNTASSDGQFFSAGGAGEAMNLAGAKYGIEPGIKAYSHVSDQFAPFAVQTIPATASEALYILDGLLMNDAGRRVREHYADTGGFTDHVFALCAILGFTFAPRIRDLPSKRLYAFDPAATHLALRPMVAARIKTERIARNWPDILRIAATAVVGTVAPSQLLKKLSAYSPQNELALALREVGRVERTLFILRWISEAPLQRRAQAGLNKGEAHHSLKRAIAPSPARRDQRSYLRRPALPHGRAQSPRRDHHSLEHRSPRRNRSRPHCLRRAAGPGTPCSCLPPRLGAHQPHRRISLDRLR